MPAVFIPSTSVGWGKVRVISCTFWPMVLLAVTSRGENSDLDKATWGVADSVEGVGVGDMVERVRVVA